MSQDHSFPWERVLFLASLLLLLGLEIYYWPFVVDDAYISFRYARNLAQGQGLVFNPGERVEGYSNFLWVLLLGLLYRVGFEDLRVVAKGLGALASLGNLFVIYRMGLLFEPKGNRLWALLAPLFLATSIPFAAWAMGGLETHLFTLFLMAGVYFFLKSSLDQRQSLWGGEVLSSLFFLLAALTRFEGLFFFLLTFSFGTLFFGSQTNRKARVAAFFCFFIPYSFFCLFKLLYYGSLVPQSIQAKSLFYSSSTHLAFLSPQWLWFVLSNSEGKWYFKSLFESHGLGIYLTFASSLFLLRGREPFRLLYLYLYLLLLAASFGYYLYGDWMPLFRLMVPLWPLTCLITQEGLKKAHSFFSSRGLARPLLLKGTLALVLVGGIFSFLYQLSTTTLPYQFPYRCLQLGRALAQSSEQEDTLITYVLGAVPYEAGMRAYDVQGLVKPSSALHYVEDYPSFLMTLQPTYILLHVPWTVGGEELWTQPDLRRNYLAYDVSLLLPQAYLFIRKDARDKIAKQVEQGLFVPIPLPGEAIYMQALEKAMAIVKRQLSQKPDQPWIYERIHYIKLKLNGKRNEANKKFEGGDGAKNL